MRSQAPVRETRRALQSACGVKTVGDLGKNKVVRAAVELVDLGNTAG